MKFKLILLIAAAALIATVVLHRSKPAAIPRELPQLEAVQSSDPAEAMSGPAAEAPVPKPKTGAPVPTSPNPLPLVTDLARLTNKLERLAWIRETFHTLAAGDKTAALRAAKQLTDSTERETALLTLVTEWTNGELRSPRQRAHAIEVYGLEAGLGMELAASPDLAVLWANEMTQGADRTALMQRAAVTLAGSDPATAFALAQQVPEGDRAKFVQAVLAGWAESDTGAALQWADQITDPAAHDAALQAIRGVAPVGIGTELKMEDGYAVINGLIPGAPAELSGQLHAGDRILALAQGDNAFVDARGIALKDIVDMIRGAPGTVLQLQVLAANAPAGSAPQFVSITRDQLIFKR